jgi:hypothetical protein
LANSIVSYCNTHWSHSSNNFYLSWRNFYYALGN